MYVCVTGNVNNSGVFTRTTGQVENDIGVLTLLSYVGVLSRRYVKCPNTPLRPKYDDDADAPTGDLFTSQVHSYMCLRRSPFGYCEKPCPGVRRYPCGGATDRKTTQRPSPSPHTRPSSTVKIRFTPPACSTEIQSFIVRPLDP